jgi:hypothetical protein
MKAIVYPMTEHLEGRETKILDIIIPEYYRYLEIDYKSFLIIQK